MVIKTNISNNILTIAAVFLDYTDTTGELLSDFKNEKDFAFISDTVGKINGSNYQEGYLLFNTDINVKSGIDIDGTLNISDINAENVYSINEMGELIKTIY